MKVLIVGLGSIGLKHLHAIKKIQPDAEIFALRSSQPSGEIEGVVNLYNTTEIDSLKLDFAIISNPTSLHKKAIEKLVEFGFPLFIEKPLFSSLDIDELVNFICQKKILTYVACNLRFLDSIRFIKDQLLKYPNKRLNEVNVYCGSPLPKWRTGSDYRKSYSAIPELGGGVHLDLIHELDYIFWLLGAPEKVNRNFRNKSSLSIAAFDYANYLLDYSGFCVNVVLNYYRSEAKRNLELVFEDETWDINLLINQVKCNNEILFSSKQRIFDTYETQMIYFWEYIRKKKQPMNSIFEAHEVLKICLEP